MKYFFKRLLRSNLAADPRSGNNAFWFRFDEFSDVVTGESMPTFAPPGLHNAPIRGDEKI